MKLSVNVAALAFAAAVQATYINYTTVTGYFLQDEPSTDPDTFDYTAVNFGLINRTYPIDKELGHKKLFSQWERFHLQVQDLNKRAPRGTGYKVLFMGRHGQGSHNVAESFYGTPAWNCYWSLLDGNATANWADANLTPNGVAQAQAAHDLWQKLFHEQGMHAPDSYFVSPLTRCLETANVTFSGLHLPAGSTPFRPLVKELFREGISIHTCDNRRSRTYIHDLFPTWPIEAGFTEIDELWNGVTAETDEAQAIRSKRALDQVFSLPERETGTFVSITSHSGELRSILGVLGHRDFSLNTGAVIPVLVKAVTERKDVPTAATTFTPSAHCTAPPVTSVASCVCASSAVPVTTPLVTPLGSQL